MDIKIYQQLEGAKKARGIAVVIDVFRAFTTECFLMANHAKTILPVADVDVAYRLKKENPDFILLGERKEVMLPGFQYGNSPANIEKIDFTGKTVIHTTSAGTQGIENAFMAEEILTGAFVNAPAIVQYIKKKNPKEVSFVCMGKAAVKPAEEDTFCAEYMKSLLEGKEYAVAEKIKSLRHLEGKRFFRDDNQIQCPKRDFYLSTQVGLFDFVLRAEAWEKEKGLYHIVKVGVSNEK